METITKCWQDETGGSSDFENLVFPDGKYWKTCTVEVAGTKGTSNFEVCVNMGGLSNSYSFSLGNGKTKKLICQVENCCPITVTGKLSRPWSSFEGAGGKVKVTCEYSRDFNPSRWMNELKDDLSLTQVNIPGTHETCARYGTALAECQSLNISEQLTKGIRFMDIRCRHINDSFAIHHGLVYQKINFDQVLDQCGDFLGAHPSEFILMSVKEEYDPEGNKNTFEQTFDQYIGRKTNLFFLENRLPKVAEVRGKIVILRRFPIKDENLKRGIDLSDWKDNTSFTITLQDKSKVIVQDRYVYDIFGGKDYKWNAISTLLDAARKDTGVSSLCLNFSSATGLSAGNPVANPRYVANEINPLLSQYLYKNPKGRSGIIAMDFPGTDLIFKIALSNLMSY